MWSQIEPSAAILCACFVTYRPLFRDLRVRNIFSSFSRRSASKGESDVSRRFPTNIPISNLGSDEGFVDGKRGFGTYPSLIGFRGFEKSLLIVFSPGTTTTISHVDVTDEK